MEEKEKAAKNGEEQSGENGEENRGMKVVVVNQGKGKKTMAVGRSINTGEGEALTWGKEKH